MALVFTIMVKMFFIRFSERTGVNVSRETFTPVLSENLINVPG
jgi:hypothetical protein